MSVNMGRGNSVTELQLTNERPDWGPVSQSEARKGWCLCLTFGREPQLIISEERVSEEIPAAAGQSLVRAALFPEI